MSKVQSHFRARLGRRKSPPTKQDSNLCQRTRVIQSENADIEISLSPTPTKAAKSRAGSVSPSTVCQQRRFSPVIITEEQKEATHEYAAAGRTAVIVKVVPAAPPLHDDHALYKKMAPPSELLMSSTASTASSSISSLSSAAGAAKPPPVPKTVHRRSCSTVVETSRPSSIKRLTSAPMEPTESEFLSCPAPLRLDAWTEPPGTSFYVRGPTYVADKKKELSEQSVFRLLTVDMVQCSKPIMAGLCSHPGERFQKALAREQKTGVKELPEFVFAVNLALPGPPNYHVVFYFGVDDVQLIKTNDTPFGRLAQKFFFGDSDSFRDETFKLIPRIVDGNFIVKSAVGSKPSIVGSKLKQVYIRSERFMELIVDIGSNSVAQKIVKLSTGYAKSLVVDMAFVLEGNTEATLPEQIMGAVRLKNLDFEKRDGQRQCATQ